MSWYDLEMRANTLWGGNDPPQQSRAQLFLALYGLQDMSPEARLAKSEKLEAAFAKIKQDWKDEGFSNDEP